MAVGSPEIEVARRRDVTAKIDADVVRVAKIVAAYRDITLAEYLSETLAPIVRDDLKREQEREGLQSPPRPRGRG